MKASIPQDQMRQAAQRLPGVRPVGQADWITVDANYADQIAEKQVLLGRHKSAVYQMLPAAADAAAELLEEVLALLLYRSDFALSDGLVTCPDGRSVDVGRGDPLIVLSQVLQEDLCIHLKSGEVHYLMGALLCFPASWTLAEKIGKPLVGVHAPVDAYDAQLAKRVQRLFDGVQVGRPLWRANALRYEDPALYQPRAEADKRPGYGTERGQFMRSERQTLFRLPRTRAVVFAIHTIVARA